MAPNHGRVTRTDVVGAAWLTILLAAVALTVPFLAGADAAARWSSVAAGITLLLLGSASAWAAASGHARAAVAPAITAVLVGAWFAAVPLFTPVAGAVAAAHALVGVLVVLAAAYNAWVAALAAGANRA